MPREPLAGFFRALSDPLRLRIVALLKAGPLCVGDLVSLLRAPQPTVSRHLAVLRGARLLQVERRGNWLFYSLARAARQRAAVLEALGEELSADVRRARALRRKGGCCPGAYAGAKR